MQLPSCYSSVASVELHDFRNGLSGIRDSKPIDGLFQIAIASAAEAAPREHDRCDGIIGRQPARGPTTFRIALVSNSPGRNGNRSLYTLDKNRAYTGKRHRDPANRSPWEHRSRSHTCTAHSSYRTDSVAPHRKLALRQSPRRFLPEDRYPRRWLPLLQRHRQPRLSTRLLRHPVPYRRQRLRQRFRWPPALVIHNRYSVRHTAGS